MLENFIVFLIASVGLTHIVVDGSIFASVRGWIQKLGWKWLIDLSTCYQCSSVWLSIPLTLAIDPLQLPWYTEIPICAFSASYAAMLGAAILNYLDRPWGNQ